MNRRFSFTTKMLATLTALLAVTGPLKANLGDTETQLYKRYGKVQAPPEAMTNKDVTFYFHYKDYVVGVTMIEGQSHRETFVKPGYAPFTDKELQAVLDGNALGSKWNVMQDSKDVKIWMLETHAAIAGYEKNHPFLTLETHGMVEFNDAVKAMREKQLREQQQQPRP